MRTNIELDDGLVEEAFRLTNVRTKKELIHH
jgi:Arc/MetJ family transcription regulator